jgi:UDP-N-acetylglucosamine 1-carboxyvinyltransferase
MSNLLIEGGVPLSGTITVGGNKNAALPLLAACLLTDQECVLTNVPRIGDVGVMIELLRDLGADVAGPDSGTLRIRCPKLTRDEPSPALVGRLRGSVLLLGPMLARQGRARLASPGGDFPARRTIAMHLRALGALGAEERDGGHNLEAPRGLRGASMYLEEASVTGTETALLAAASACGTTEIRHAACEPHVVELCEFLAKMGARVTGAGTHTIRVEGAPRLSGATHHLNGDYIEAGSWAVVAAVTRGAVEVRGARACDMEVVASVLERMRVRCELDESSIRVHPSTPVGGSRITTGLWPGFPSDLISLVTVLATQADGRTLLHDWMYELRLFALEQLSGMGADLFLCDPHRIIVSGPKPLRGRALDTRDLRSGMALVAAALAAEGRSRVGPMEIVERGYAGLLENLRSLGARAERDDSNP